MSEAFRYFEERRGTPGRSRTGLAGVGTGNGGAAPYQMAALQPGQRGFWASGFGNAPTDDTPDRALPAAPAAPAPAAAAASAQPGADASTSSPALGGGGGDGASNIGLMEGPPGDLTNLIGDLGINGRTAGGVIGASLGSLAFGPVGGLVGGLAGRALGGYLGGDGSAGGDKGNMGNDAKGGGQNEGFGGGTGVAAGDIGGSKGDVGNAAKGLAEGGRVGPQHLEYGRQAMQKHGKKGLRSVGGSYMGGYADGGMVPYQTDMDAAGQEAYRQTRPVAVSAHTPTGAYDPRIAMNNVRSSGAANALERVPGPVGEHDTEMVRLLASRPDLLQAIIQQQGSVHPVNPASPSTGYLGAYAQGGPVPEMPDYSQGGTVTNLAGPNPPGADDGFAALDGGEFVTRAAMAQQPQYAPILEQINAGTYDPAAAGAGAGTGPLMSIPGQSVPDAGTSSRVASMDPHSRSMLVAAVQQDPMLEHALTALLGPEGMSLLLGANMGADGMDTQSVMDSRAPLAGPPPMPGTASPPGFPPPAQRRGGLASIVNA